jgi:pyruvate dehydrogenase E1 component alpha subunit
MDDELAKRLYGEMLLIRRFEEKVLEVFAGGKLAGTMFHVCIGEEAVAVGVCSVLERKDYITSTHRGHGHFIAKGGDLKLMMAELYGKAGGYCRGKGGSMHIADINLGHLGANGIVGGGLGIATGSAYASLLRRSSQVTVCFFGDGAANEGIFHESLNMAGLWKLPIVYVCENNHYALSTSYARAFTTETISGRAPSYGMAGVTVDGMDVLAVRDAAEQAVERARSGGGPTLLECRTYRFYGHSRGDPSGYRTREEEKQWRDRCPVKSFERRLLDDGVLGREEIEGMEREIAQKLEEACSYADASPYPGAQSMYEDLYAEGSTV